MDQIERGEVGTVVIAHKDRLARFGFDYLPSIVHTFSCRVYGLRRYERALQDELGGGGR